MSDIEQLLQIMSRLRDPDGGCPWDTQQTFATIAPYTIEEAHEVADAIDREAWDELPDELGDLLFQVVFHAQMGAEADLFDFDDVVAAIVDKMVRRHPHVFGGAAVGSAKAQRIAWETHKQEERGSKSQQQGRMSPVARGLPSLHRAVKLQKKAAEVGFDWGDATQVVPKLHEEVAELAAAMAEERGTGCLAEELGDLLFSCVNLARHLDLDADSALRGANLKFERRFRRMEVICEERGADLPGDDHGALNALWEQAKREGL